MADEAKAEIDAMRVVLEAVTPLSMSARCRVIEWCRKALLTTADRSERASGPRAVIRSVIAESSGLTLKQLVAGCRGRFTTRSKDPDHIIRTVANQMASAGELVIRNGFYYAPDTITPPAAGEPEKG